MCRRNLSLLEIRLLGQFDLRQEGITIEISSRPAKTLLAYLLLTGGTHHPRERLAGLLWPESTERNARKNLRQALWHLRKSIGERYLIADTESIAFSSSSEYWLDTAILEDPVEQNMEMVVSLYEGELLPGYYEDWVLLERDRLSAVFERKIQRLLTQLLQDQRWTDARSWAERWISKGQIPEAAYRGLMVAFAATGELSKVESSYQRCVEALRVEIGVDPSSETQALYEGLMAGNTESIPSKQDGLRREGPPRGSGKNLPAQATAFVGREQELAATKQLLADTRLLTLTGPGGIGKTRLALEIADQVLDQFDHEAYFVSLAAVRADGHIIQIVADALEFPLSTQAEPEEQLLHHLRNKQLLLIMDNFEHVLEGASVVSRILQAAPGVKILATSHEKLELKGETAFALAGLNFENTEQPDNPLSTDAVELFVQSAQRARPGFELFTDDLELATRICEMIQGMPLAIELATAWLDTLTLEEISEELQRSLDILSTEMRDVPERHRSIRAAFDHSWSLINETERGVFMRLSVFRGGFARDAAHHVAGASLELLAALVRKSFVRHDPKLGRFEVHELMRQYAEERLKENPDASLSAHEAHASYYAKFMSSRWNHLRDGRQIAALEQIDADIENVRAAWRNCIDQKDTSRLRLFIQSIRLVYTIRGWNYAGMELFAGAVEALESAHGDVEAEALRALSLAHKGFFMAWLGLAEQGIELTREGAAVLRRLNRPIELLFALNGQTLCAQYLNLQDEDEQAAREMVKIAADNNDKWLEAFSLFPLSTALVQKNDYVEAGRIAEQSLRISEQIGDSIIALFNLSALGAVAFNLGEYGKARDYYLRSLSRSEKLSYRWAIENASKYLGAVAMAMNETEAAEGYFRESLRIAEEIGLGRDTINLLYEFARVRVAQDRKDRAVELLSLALEHPASRQARFGEGLIQDSAQSLLDELVEEGTPGDYAQAIKRGKELELDEVVEELISMGSQG